MYKEVIKWLNTQSIHISENYLRLRLESHPDYPSLVAVADSLGEIGIECAAYHTNKEEVIKTGKPFLAHFNFGEGHILFFPDIETAQQKVKDFDRHWSGVVMLAEKSGKYGNAEHDRQYKEEKRNKFFASAAIAIILSALTGLAISHNSIASLLLILSNAGGLYLSWLITQKEFGISNSISDKICSMAKHSRCESVLFSKGARLLNWLTWGDVGIIYFSASILYIAAALFTASNLQLYYYISVTGLLFPLYSLYYQWKVVKQWCMLCIAVLAALLINTIVSISYLNSPAVPNRNILIEAAAFILLSAIVLSAWLILKSLFQKGIRSLDNEIKTKRLKRNPEIFNALLEKEIANPLNLPEKNEAIHFGSPTAPYQLLIACNPYCGPCAKAHHAIETIYQKYPEDLSITIRFALQNNNETDSKVIAVKEIMRAAKEKPFEAIRDWYNVLNLDKFKEKHHTNGTDINGAIDKQIEWGKAAEIKATPTIFVNGRRLPELYSWVDFVETLEFEVKK